MEPYIYAKYTGETRHFVLVIPGESDRRLNAFTEIDAYAEGANILKFKREAREFAQVNAVKPAPTPPFSGDYPKDHHLSGELPGEDHWPRSK